MSENYINVSIIVYAFTDPVTQVSSTAFIIQSDTFVTYHGWRRVTFSKHPTLVPLLDAINIVRAHNALAAAVRWHITAIQFPAMDPLNALRLVFRPPGSSILFPSPNTVHVGALRGTLRFLLGINDPDTDHNMPFVAYIIVTAPNKTLVAITHLRHNHYTPFMLSPKYPKHDIIQWHQPRTLKRPIE